MSHLIPIADKGQRDVFAGKPLDGMDEIGDALFERQPSDADQLDFAIGGISALPNLHAEKVFDKHLIPVGGSGEHRFRYAHDRVHPHQCEVLN